MLCVQPESRGESYVNYVNTRIFFCLNKCPLKGCFGTFLYFILRLEKMLFVFYLTVLTLARFYCKLSDSFYLFVCLLAWSVIAQAGLIVEEDLEFESLQ